MTRDTTFDVGTYLQLEGQTPEYFNKEIAGSPIEIFGASVINLAIALIGTIGVTLLIVAGLRLLMARGDSSKIDEAKEMIKLVLFGIMIALMAYIIVLSIQSFFSG